MLPLLLQQLLLLLLEHGYLALLLVCHGQHIFAHI
jgi:hypothetical protein